MTNKPDALQSAGPPAVPGDSQETRNKPAKTRNRGQSLLLPVYALVLLLILGAAFLLTRNASKAPPPIPASTSSPILPFDSLPAEVQEALRAWQYQDDADAALQAEKLWRYALAPRNVWIRDEGNPAGVTCFMVQGYNVREAVIVARACEGK
jgi:hypothetical protein